MDQNSNLSSENYETHSDEEADHNLDGFQPSTSSNSSNPGNLSHQPKYNKSNTSNSNEDQDSSIENDTSNGENDSTTEDSTSDNKQEDNGNDILTTDETKFSGSDDDSNSSQTDSQPDTNSSVDSRASDSNDNNQKKIVEKLVSLGYKGPAIVKILQEEHGIKTSAQTLSCNWKQWAIRLKDLDKRPPPTPLSPKIQAHHGGSL
ncbi:hypothetical protein PCASD_24947 [Puccinia coronata f. sp. avenae]|uniref:Uncharacterized protein n=1 Tax=Puccinia coronata f. sp. avenae TaxID=200324 RepID=A0A2N5S5Z1_9BASI|nr:hypothetical protein PCASD_24947 [Puccinia coronata f. sp. avenae]